ncbi:translocation/assembly module TamB domain-containing protein [Beggiatoa leptomitoformis]
MLSLGTYLTPQLYVGYGLSLVNQNRIFNIRYELSRKWGVEASIGTEDKGADFSYILEW